MGNWHCIYRETLSHRPLKVITFRVDSIGSWHAEVVKKKSVVGRIKARPIFFSGAGGETKSAEGSAARSGFEHTSGEILR
jgi:hypothetical protein